MFSPNTLHFEALATENRLGWTMFFAYFSSGFDLVTVAVIVALMFYDFVPKVNAKNARGATLQALRLGVAPCNALFALRPTAPQRRPRKTETVMILD